MARPLSEDLRIRVVRAVEGGMTRRAAAERFGISVSSAVRFVKEWRESGATKAKRIGGDQRSQHIEEHHEAIMAVTQPMSGPISRDTNYTYKFDVPWDWAHRYPPGFFANPAQPLSPPVAYVPGCPAQIVTVLGSDGKDQTVTVVRC